MGSTKERMPDPVANRAARRVAWDRLWQILLAPVGEAGSSASAEVPGADAPAVSGNMDARP